MSMIARIPPGGMAAMTQRTLSRRGFLTTLAGVSGTALLAACTSAPPTPSSSAGATQAPAAGAGQVTLRVQERANNVVQGGPQYQLYQAHLDQWKAAHPNVDVQVESLPTGSEYNTKVLSLLMG